jgi:hypothetical protein
LFGHLYHRTPTSASQQRSVRGYISQAVTQVHIAAIETRWPRPATLQVRPHEFH